MTPPREEVISAKAARTLDGLFRERLRLSPDRIAYRSYDEASRTWVSRTWSQTAERVRRWQAGLAGEGLKAGDRVAIMAPNGWDWVCFDLAALGLGLIVVPLFARDRADNSAYVLQHSGAKLLVIGDGDIWNPLAAEQGATEGLVRAVSLKPVPGPAGDLVRLIGDWLPEPAARLSECPSNPESLATIVYTSGTTGRPKGVMLSHHNILSNAEAGIRAVSVRSDDEFLSFLPLSHMFERTVGYYVPMMAGATVSHARSVQDLAEDLKSCRPTVVISVPLVFERIYCQLRERLDIGSAFSRWLFGVFVGAGWASFQYEQGRQGWNPLQIFAPLSRRIVGKALLAQLGGRLRLAVSGGAALQSHISRVFLGVGLRIVQGYGLTETSPVICVNRPDDNVPSSVGRPFEKVEVRLAEGSAENAPGGELEVRGPNVMLGYWQNEEATRNVMTADGWFKTGDRVRIEDGRVYIVGRSKEVIVLNNGEKVPPDDMEKAISLDSWFPQAVIFGENRPHLGALVVPNEKAWAQIAVAQGLDRDPAKAVKDAKGKKLILERIESSLHDFPGYAKIRDVLVTDEPWTVENGLLTPTLKKKRERILSLYQERIDALYGSKAPGSRQPG